MLSDCGFRLVRVVVSGRNGKTVQIMAERPDGTMTVRGMRGDLAQPVAGARCARPDCGRSTRSRCPRPASTGRWCGRPISRIGPGYEAKIELKEPIEGRKRFRGMLEGVEDDEVRIEVELGQTGPPGDRACRSGSSPRRGWC